ncbi:MAG: hypothetical protein R3359_12375 [Marinirhabdus sp.]|nr:hypothetical protein [Marinirhabdus sp.]
MELTRIESLLEAYFEGHTSLEDEKILADYFSSPDVAPHHKAYVPMFAAFSNCREEVLEKEVELPKETSSNSKWWIGIAASAVIAIGVAGFVFQEPGMTAEEKEALAAFHKTKEAFQLLSESFNEGAEELTYVSKFAETKNKILK